jgi:hypothetical protein
MGEQYQITPEMLYEQTRQQAIENNELRLQLAAVLAENRRLRELVEQLTPTNEPDDTPA